MLILRARRLLLPKSRLGWRWISITIAAILRLLVASKVIAKRAKGGQSSAKARLQRTRCWPKLRANLAWARLLTRKLHKWQERLVLRERCLLCLYRGLSLSIELLLCQPLLKATNAHQGGHILLSR